MDFMTLLVFDYTQLIPRLLQIFSIIVKYPGAYLPIIGAWIVTAIYFIAHPSEKPGFTYAMSTGIAMAFTAVSVIFRGVATYSVTIPSAGFFVMLAMIIYGVVLIVLSIFHLLPEILADIFGDPGHVFVPTMLALFFIDGGVPIDLTTLTVIAVPTIVLIAAKYIRMLMGHQ